MKLAIFCCHVDPVDVTYLVCCYIRMFTCQLKIKFFFTNKTMCSVIVWTFTSCRFCGKLCCCNQLVPKSFSLVGILLITWVFHPNSTLGWQILQQIMDRILTCSWNTFQVFRAFFFKTRPSPFLRHSISRLQQMKHELLVMFIFSRVTSWAAAFYQLYLNETKRWNVTALYIFS